jgi:hypothetical protein
MFDDEIMISQKMAGVYVIFIAFIGICFGFFMPHASAINQMNATNITNTTNESIDLSFRCPPITCPTCPECIQKVCPVKDCTKELDTYKSLIAYQRAKLKDEEDRLKLIQTKYEQGYGENCTTETGYLSDDVVTSLGFYQQCYDYSHNDKELHDACGYAVKKYESLNEYLMIYHDACESLRHVPEYKPDMSARPYTRYEKYSELFKTAQQFVRV